MAFPSVTGTGGNFNDTISTSHAITFPTGTGGKVFVFFIAAGTINDPPAGWTVVRKYTGSNSVSMMCVCETTSGSGGGSLSIGTVSTTRSSHGCLRISGSADVTFESLADEPDLDPPAVTPSGGADDFLWLAACAGSASDYTYVVQANYTGLIQFGNTSSSAGTRSKMAVSYRQLNASSENPGAFTTTGGVAGALTPMAMTVAVKPSTSGGDTTPPTLSGWQTNSGGTQITSTLSESAVTDSGGTSGTGGFTLSGTSATVSGWAISGTTLTLTLSGTILNTDTVTVSYDRANTTNDIRDSSNNYLANFSGVSVTNNVNAGSPTAPSGLSATGQYQKIRLNWTDNSNNESSFRIERAPDVSGAAGTYAEIGNVSANVVTYSDTTVSGTTTYWYRVRARNANGDSSYTTAVSQHANSSVTVTWGASAGTFPSGNTSSVSDASPTVNLPQYTAPGSAQTVTFSATNDGGFTIANINSTITAVAAPAMTVVGPAGSVADGGSDAAGTLPANTTRSYTLANTGTGTLTISGLTLPGTVTQTTSITNGTTIVQNSSITLTIRINSTTNGSISIASNDAATPYNWTLTATVDSTLPTLSAFATNAAGTQITATISKSGTLPVSGNGGFSLSGTTATVSSWSISGTTLTIPVSGPILQGQTVKINYAKAATFDDITDSIGNLLADFANATVTNNSTAQTFPAPKPGKGHKNKGATMMGADVALGVIDSPSPKPIKSSVAGDTVTHGQIDSTSTTQALTLGTAMTRGYDADGKPIVSTAAPSTPLVDKSKSQHSVRIAGQSKPQQYKK